MIRSGCTCMMAAMNLKRVGRSSIRRPSRAPRQAMPAPTRSASRFASEKRRAATLAGSPGGLPPPSVAMRISMCAPICASRSKVPPQSTSRSSGWAPIARTFIRYYLLRSGLSSIAVLYTYPGGVGKKRYLWYFSLDKQPTLRSPV